MSDPLSIEQLRRQCHKVAVSLSLGIGYVCCSKSTYSINFERNPVNHQLYMRPSIRLGTEAKEKVYSMKVWRYPWRGDFTNVSKYSSVNKKEHWTIDFQCNNALCLKMYFFRFPSWPNSQKQVRQETFQQARTLNATFTIKSSLLLVFIHVVFIYVTIHHWNAM